MKCETAYRDVGQSDSMMLQANKARRGEGQTVYIEISSANGLRPLYNQLTNVMRRDGGNPLPNRHLEPSGFTIQLRTSTNEA